MSLSKKPGQGMPNNPNVKYTPDLDLPVTPNLSIPLSFYFIFWLIKLGPNTFHVPTPRSYPLSQDSRVSILQPNAWPGHTPVIIISFLFHFVTEYNYSFLGKTGCNYFLTSSIQILLILMRKMSYTAHKKQTRDPHK